MELARRGYAAFDAHDPAGVLDFLDPDIEAHDFPEMPDTAVYRGLDGYLALVGNTLAEFDDFRLEAEEFIPLGDDHVLVLVHQVGRGKESGAEVEARIAHLWRIRDGRAVELHLFGTEEEARAAASRDQ